MIDLTKEFKFFYYNSKDFEVFKNTLKETFAYKVVSVDTTEYFSETEEDFEAKYEKYLSGFDKVVLAKLYLRHFNVERSIPNKQNLIKIKIYLNEAYILQLVFSRMKKKMADGNINGKSCMRIFLDMNAFVESAKEKFLK